MQRSTRSIFAVPIIIALGGYFVFNSELDGLRTYEPSSPEIENLAIATTLTPEAQQIFYRQDPQIAPSGEFHSLCSQVNHKPEKTVLLGCFTSDGYRGRIIIQSVTDPRLDGTMEVVAAHELLHAAYQKLSPQERRKLAPKLEQAAKTVTDPFLLPVIEAYQSGNREIYYNELHSYLGTELQNLGDPELEAYYQQYFRDRQKVVALAQKSRSTLRKLEDQADQLLPEIDQLEANLKYEEQTLKQTEAELDSSAQQLDAMKSNLVDLQSQAEQALRNGNSSLVAQFDQAQAEYNAEVRYYNSRLESHRDRVQQFNQNYDLYKQKVQTYNQLNQNKKDILDTLKLDS